MIKDRDERPKGFGYVEFGSLDDLKGALDKSGTVRFDLFFAWFEGKSGTEARVRFVAVCTEIRAVFASMLLACGWFHLGAYDQQNFWATANAKAGGPALFALYLQRYFAELMRLRSICWKCTFLVTCVQRRTGAHLASSHVRNTRTSSEAPLGPFASGLHSQYMRKAHLDIHELGLLTESLGPPILTISTVPCEVY